MLKGELRCMCARKPLLGKYGKDSKGNLYVHVKIFKQKRIYGEIVFTHGVVRLRCRECFRWHTVRIRQPKESVSFTEEPLPVDIPV
jgi:hypothetical protein